MRAWLWNLFKKTLLCIWFITVAFPIFMFFEKPPVSVYQDRKIEPSKLLPGEEFTIHISASMSKDCPADVRREVTDSTGRPIDLGITPRPKRESYPVTMTVPIGAFPGPAEYQATIYWQCNWVQKLFLSFGSPSWYPFVVKPPPIPFEILPTPEQLPLLEKQGKINYLISPTDTTNVEIAE